MHIKSISKLLLVLVAIFSFSVSKAQVPDSKKNYAKKPYWIEMMNNPNSNYFETVKAYDTFWEKRKKPKEEDDKIGEKEKKANEKKNIFQRWFKSREEKEEEEAKKYRLDCKKYEHWKMKVKPYVQPDGRILSAQEQLDLWKKQQAK
jgi:hypothetical protein